MTDAVALLIKIVKRCPHLLELQAIQRALGKVGLKILSTHFPKAMELFHKFFPEDEQDHKDNRPRRMR